MNPRTPIPNTDPYPAPACYDTRTPNETLTPNSELAQPDTAQPDTVRATAPAQPNQLIEHAEPDSGIRTQTDQSQDVGIGER